MDRVAVKLSAALQLPDSMKVKSPYQAELAPVPADSVVSPDAAGRYPAHIDTMLSYTYVREEAPGNQGPEIDKFLCAAGLDNKPDYETGYAWCAAAVSYALEAADVLSPTLRDARSRVFRPKANWTQADVLRGAVIPSGALTVHRYSTVSGHLGGLLRQEGRGRRATLHTVEGNTSCPETSEAPAGEGLCRKTRKVVGSNYLAPILYVDVKQRQ